MILILSEDNDISTVKVIDWMISLNIEFVRINVQDIIELEFEGNDIKFKTKFRTFYLSKITGFWFRRGYLSINNNFKTEIPQFDSLQKNEFQKLLEYMYYKLNIIRHINSINKSDVNKLIVNKLSKDLGIITPTDLIFSNSKSLTKYVEKNKNKYISKVISGNCMHIFNDFTMFNYTTNLEVIDINAKTFFPSLVQNKIEKKYELRIFYLDGAFYSMAIFSQNDVKTSVDFRNYNNEKPNRNVPYKLPTDIEIKLDLLMKKLDINCGSIDMIVTPKNDFVFLEVNPVGQFDMISYPCNYNLEEKIAKYFLYE